MSSKIVDLKLLDNKQMLHIVSEVVVLIGLTFYFSSQNKKLHEHIESVHGRLEKQEDKIQKLETTIQQMSTVITQLSQGVQQIGGNTAILANRVASLSAPELKKPKKPVPKPVSEQKPTLVKSKVRFTPSVKEVPEEEEDQEEEIVETEDDIIEEEDEEELSDSDLDAEIREELNELNDTQKTESTNSDQQTGLKKQS